MSNFIYSSSKFTQLFYILFIILALFSSCSEDSNNNNPTITKPELKFAVFSDIHVYNADLGSTGSAYEEYLATDRKMLAESSSILESLVNSIIIEKPDFVLIPGDLTKDGEKLSHELVAKQLKLLEEKGIKVFVCPGNHDINNPSAYSYSGDKKVSTPTVTPEEFATIYNDFGYQEAIFRDNNSLSYIAEINSNLWILSMDACQYKLNTGKTYPITGGKFNTETVNWIKEKLTLAKEKNIQVLGILHHGLVEHFKGQKTNLLSEDYVVDDYNKLSNEFAALGLKIVFTGHFHANDIVKKTNGNDFIFDIETGSTVTYPSAYRINKLTSDNKLDITTKYITTINYDLKGKSFQDYGKELLFEGINGVLSYNLITKFSFSDSLVNIVNPPAVGAFVSHIIGDEVFPEEHRIIAENLKKENDIYLQIIANTIIDLYTDLEPADLNLIINLENGSSQKK